MVKVLFVCMGNICRSPSAEGVFRDLVVREGIADQFHIDSCGTLDFHTGEAPDSRAQSTAKNRGIDISGLRARQYRQRDFDEFDYILVMDRVNMHDMGRDCPEHHRHKMNLFCDFAQNFDECEVPDPYYGGAQGFEHVYDLVLDASNGLLAHIREAHLS